MERISIPIDGISGTKVRDLIAHNYWEWISMVPLTVCKFIKKIDGHTRLYHLYMSENYVPEEYR